MFMILLIAMQLTLPEAYAKECKAAPVDSKALADVMSDLKIVRNDAVIDRKATSAAFRNRGGKRVFICQNKKSQLSKIAELEAEIRSIKAKSWLKAEAPRLEARFLKVGAIGELYDPPQVSVQYGKQVVSPGQKSAVKVIQVFPNEIYGQIGDTPVIVRGINTQGLTTGSKFLAGVCRAGSTETKSLAGGGTQTMFVLESLSDTFVAEGKRAAEQLLKKDATRAWRDSSNAQIAQGVLISFDGEDVVIETEDHTNAKLSLKSLCDSDRKYVGQSLGVD